MAAQDWLELGRIGSPFGVKGWVHVESYTDPPEQLLEYREWTAAGTRAASRDRAPAGGRRGAHGKAQLVARLEGIEDRDRGGAAARRDRSAWRAASCRSSKARSSIRRI